jgi:hypothetical protein
MLFMKLRSQNCLFYLLLLFFFFSVDVAGVGILASVIFSLLKYCHWKDFIFHMEFYTNLAEYVKFSLLVLRILF